MEKLARLTSKESSGEQSLDGIYRVVVDLRLTSSANVTVQDIEKKISEAGMVEDFFIERYSEKISPFNVGDTVELISDLNCTKSVYIDTEGNFVISDKPLVSHVEKVGEFTLHLPKGTLAEVNDKVAGRDTEVLFTGDSVDIEELGREAYLGILALPSHLFVKAD